jgi:hypothetical protein
MVGSWSAPFDPSGIGVNLSVGLESAYLLVCGSAQEQDPSDGGETNKDELDVLLHDAGSNTTPRTYSYRVHLKNE